MSGNKLLKTDIKKVGLFIPKGMKEGVSRICYVLHNLFLEDNFDYNIHLF